MTLSKQHQRSRPDSGDCPKCGAYFNVPIRSETHPWYPDRVAEFFRCEACGEVYESSREKVEGEVDKREEPPAGHEWSSDGNRLQRIANYIGAAFSNVFR